MQTHKYPIGFQYQTRGKHKRICTITDQLTTLNSKQQIIKIAYVSTHEFAGQTVTDHDVCETSVSMGACRMQGVSRPADLVISV